MTRSVEPVDTRTRASGALHAAARVIAVLLSSLAFAVAPFETRAGATSEVFAFGLNPGLLRMFVYVPDHLRASPALVVALHGCSQTAAEYGGETGWTALAERWGFVLLLPQQQTANNEYLCFNWFNGDSLSDFWWPGNDQERDQGAALSIKHMVDKMKTVYDIEPRRTFVTGLSAGGAMAAVMLATYPDVFGAGAIVAGVPYKCASTGVEALSRCGIDLNHEGKIRIKNLSPSQWGNEVRNATPFAGPWPRLSIWQGTSDKTVDPANARELAEQWSNVHGVSRMPIENKVKGYRHQMFRDSAGNIVVERYFISSMDHGTPVDPGPKTDQCGKVGTFSLATRICAAYYIGKFWGLDRLAP